MTAVLNSEEKPKTQSGREGQGAPEPRLGTAGMLRTGRPVAQRGLGSCWQLSSRPGLLGGEAPLSGQEARLARLSE